MPATSESRIRTLGLRTDLAIEGGRAIVSEHEQFIAVRTPSNPGYYFGNCLIFDRAPAAGDGERWPELFGEVFASDENEFAVPQGLYVRRFRCDNDWKAQFDLSMATRDEVHESESYARFKAAQIAYHRKISEDFGAWLGMFDGAQLVGSCGIYSIGDGIARYQDVGVLSAYRNRRIARCGFTLYERERALWIAAR